MTDDYDGFDGDDDSEDELTGLTVQSENEIFEWLRSEVQEYKDYQEGGHVRETDSGRHDIVPIAERVKYKLDKEGDPLPIDQVMELNSQLEGVALAEGFAELNGADYDYDNFDINDYI